MDEAVLRYRVIKRYGQNLSVKCYWLSKFGVKCYRDPPITTLKHVAVVSIPLHG